MRNLTLKQFKTVQAIVSHGKIVSAAKVLGLSPPAVTIQLRQVEEEFQLALFDRTSDGMRPTAAGLAFVEAAQAIEERLRLLEDAMDAIKGVRTGSLRLGVVSTAKYFAPRLMAGFMKEHPDIDMRLAIGNRAETIDRLKNHDIDIALMGRPPKEVSVRASVFGDHPLVIIAPPEHPLASARDISKERIAEEHFLVREPGSGTRISLEIFLSDVPGRIDDLGVEMGSNETIKQAVMADLGIAFISAHTIAAETEAGRLVILDVVGMPIRRQWFSVMRTDHVISPAMATFNDFLMRRGATYLPLFGKLYPYAEANDAARTQQARASGKLSE
ncbi:LysR family transcriptional regulator [Mesorhizobium sp. VK22B]|uniref:HTH-type transcriptional regulator CbbR n=1 Tax=Mesorhizobium captivum TaxID=3072319 RepID=A0ABU4Z4F4_9HYPH|nr:MULTISPECIES: LysR family transcriptional regulator [unclassified Mesorhizobium]MDX8494128.1 LysR family transcriptional regulator [Mesorhizobium sp. VK22B]MDX8507420.1 LysR family transcriptional regulator [Mesorhizobium sp. VK22E]